MDLDLFESTIWPLRGALTARARSLGCGADAEDVVAETFATLVRKLSQTAIDDSGHLVKLAYKILMGHVANLQRAQRRRNLLAQRCAKVGTVDTADPHVVLEERNLVTELLAQVSPTHRKTLIMSVEGYTIREIACAQHITYAAAAKRLARGRAEARQVGLSTRSVHHGSVSDT